MNFQESPLDDKARTTAKKLFGDLSSGFYVKLPKFEAGESYMVGISDADRHYGIAAAQGAREDNTARVLIVGEPNPTTGSINRQLLCFGRNGIVDTIEGVDELLDSLTRATFNQDLTQKLYDFCLNRGESVSWPLKLD